MAPFGSHVSTCQNRVRYGFPRVATRRDNSPHMEDGTAPLFGFNLVVCHEVGNYGSHGKIMVRPENRPSEEVFWEGKREILRQNDGQNCRIDFEFNMVRWRKAGIQHEGVSPKSDVLLFFLINASADYNRNVCRIWRCQKSRCVCAISVVVATLAAMLSATRSIAAADRPAVAIEACMSAAWSAAIECMELTVSFRRRA